MSDPVSLLAGWTFRKGRPGEKPELVPLAEVAKSLRPRDIIGVCHHGQLSHAGWNWFSEVGATCRICGCTDDDCSWCIALTGEPCSWHEPDLCSACERGGNFSIGTGYWKNDVDRARCRGRRAMYLARRRSGRAPGFMPLAEHGEKCLRVCVRIEIAELHAAQKKTK